ncbi:Chromatin modification-related protein eaf3 [Penicillium angulare]|uniref:Chromatin modification-related protein eaf3 n=1 Tax=Penicillium angulare TaxID=116970 RepID=UPI00253FDC7A|nr:Chromatin modification-related protein eaf3 [Penicillium angulare]KAJ5273400.1 Chromatin modification-related protein eaf3 [Penicillium angulare]
MPNRFFLRFDPTEDCPCCREPYYPFPVFDGHIELGTDREESPSTDLYDETDETWEETTDEQSESNTSEQEEQFHARPSIRIVMPDNIKSLIVDDWERVTKNGSVVKLPAPKPVHDILQDWRAEELPKRHRFDVTVMDEVIAGLSEYFEVVLDKLLLYRYERHQYRVLKKKYQGANEKSPIFIYGAEHLIRLFSEFIIPIRVDPLPL